LRVEGGLPQGRRLRRGAGVAERRTVAPEAAPVAPPKSAPWPSPPTTSATPWS